MDLSTIVNVSITVSGVQIERAGYGVPLILASDCPVDFTERVRFYTNMTEIVADFASTTATYQMAASFFAQDPKPLKVAVGRMATKFTQRWHITPTVANSTAYEMTINGNLLSYTSDADATLTEIYTGLKADLDALSIGATMSNQTTYIRVVSDTAGKVFSIVPASRTLIEVYQDHDTSATLSTDLDAIADEDSSWYAILYPANSVLDAEEIQDWASTNKKLFIAQITDSRGVTIATGSDTTSTQHILGANETGRTAPIFHEDQLEFADAALAGAGLTSDPGSETWCYKNLKGVAAMALTSTHISRLEAKGCNYYVSVAGQSVVMPGITDDGEFIDIVRLTDWTTSTIREDVAAALFAASQAGKKIPFTDGGISVVTNIVRNVLQRGVDAGGYSNDPAPKVTAPLAKNVSSANKQARTLTDVKFDAVFAGAIHKTTISGTVSF